MNLEDMDVMQILDEVSSTMDRAVLNMDRVTNLRELGLDPRASHVLYVSQECIVVPKQNDRALQYYGGFEYVDEDYRTVLGDYVIYLAEDDRVQEHIERYYNKSAEIEAETDGEEE